MAHLNNDTRNKSVEENDKFLLGYSCHGFLVYIYKSLSVRERVNGQKEGQLFQLKTLSTTTKPRQHKS